MSSRSVCVLGAGVIGVSSALCIQDTVPDVTVTIVAEHVSPNNTSDVAAGLWEPYLLGDTPDDKIRRWGGHTYEHLLRLANSAEAAEAGVFMLSGFTLSGQPMADPFWKDQVHGYRHLTTNELDHYGYRCGYNHTSVVAEGRKYIPWMMKRFAAKGGTLIKKRIANIIELSDYDVVVNCTGFRASDLVNDNKLTPVQGQIIRVRAPWIKHFILTEEGAYIIPLYDSIVLGGTALEGVSDNKVREEDTNKIWRDCCRLMPSLKEAQYISTHVGQRPVRTEVRLETDHVTSNNKCVKVVHNYGHGGAGVTLHWGCGLEAARLVGEILGARPSARL